jgi:glycerol-3-phosphate dehydrogenase
MSAGLLVLGDAAERIVFVMPHGRYVLVGTTDTDYQGDRAAVAPDSADISYLLGVLAESLPGIKLGNDDAAASFAGLRALIADSGKAPSSVPREEVILESKSGLISVAGGKLTTHREIAERVVDRVCRKLGRSGGRCPTLDAPLPGARPLDDAERRPGDDAALASLDPSVRDLIIARHGTRATLPARIAAEHPELAAPLAPNCPAIGAEVIHAARAEMVNSIDDFLVRRTALTWRAPVEAEAAAPEVARLLASELKWDRARADAELSNFTRKLARRRAAAA